MLENIIFELKQSIKVFLLMLLLLGVFYTGIVTVIAELLFPYQAHGSLLYKDAKVIGSKLIAQKFTENKYFWSRPSAVDYNPMPSSGSNLGLGSKALAGLTQERQSLFEKLPEDLLTSSASGLDPHTSPDAAYYQIQRIVSARNLNQSQATELKSLIEKHTEKRDLNILGEPRVNVLELNLEMDSLFNE